jgi:hypothetical protein
VFLEGISIPENESYYIPEENRLALLLNSWIKPNIQGILPLQSRNSHHRGRVELLMENTASKPPVITVSH